MQGIISSVGQQIPYRDFDIVLTAETSGTSNWIADASIGGDAYTQTKLTADINPSIWIDANTHFDVLPCKRSGQQVLTESDLDIFASISYAESTATGIKFVSVTGQPTADIPLTLRIYKQ